MEVSIPGVEDKYCEVRTVGISLTLAPKMRESGMERKMLNQELEQFYHTDRVCWCLMFID